MAEQIINVGTTANDGTGDTLRGAFIKAKNNFSDLYTNKQATLVSGTNIKTVNSTSLLGSGDVAVQATLVSGTNIKTIEGQSLLGSGNIDLTKSDVGLSNVDNTSDINKPISSATQTALNAKQNTLVSGTNIKTINGNTILGSGDLVVGGTTPTLQEVTDEGNSTTNPIYFNGTIPIYGENNSSFLGSENLPNGNSYAAAVDETSIGVYDTNQGAFETGFYSKRNIPSNNAETNIILSVSQAHTSIDFTIVAKNLTASKYYTINGLVTIDWANETYKYRMINTNTNVFDDADFLLFNIIFGFNSTQFEIQADNQSTNNFFININANIL
jgi:hypothetical protein